MNRSMTSILSSSEQTAPAEAAAAAPVKASREQVGAWVASLGFGDYTQMYVDRFINLGVDGEDLVDQKWFEDEEAIAEQFDIKLRVHQRKVLRNVRMLKADTALNFVTLDDLNEQRTRVCTPPLSPNPLASPTNHSGSPTNEMNRSMTSLLKDNAQTTTRPSVENLQPAPVTDPAPAPQAPAPAPVPLPEPAPPTNTFNFNQAPAPAPALAPAPAPAPAPALAPPANILSPAPALAPAPAEAAAPAAFTNFFNPAPAPAPAPTPGAPAPPANILNPAPAPAEAAAPAAFTNFFNPAPAPAPGPTPAPAEAAAPGPTPAPAPAPAEAEAEAEEMEENVVTLKLKVKDSGKNEVFSDKTFAEIGLSPLLINAASGLKWGPTCTVVQEAAIPIMLEKERTNLIAQAPSGNGKTATFVLSLLSLIEWEEQFPQALVVSHNKDLSAQTCSVINNLIEHGRLTAKGLQRAVMIVNPNKLDKSKEIPRDVVLGETPLRLTNQIVCGPPKQVKKLLGRRPRFEGGKQIKVVIFDEADSMLLDTKEDRNGPTVQGEIKELCQHCPNAQIGFFSATFEDRAKEEARKICKKYGVSKGKYKEIFLEKGKESVESIVQCYMPVDRVSEEQKFDLLYALMTGLSHNSQTLVFVGAKKTADHLATLFRAKNKPVDIFHSKVAQEIQEKVIEDFKNGKTRVLVCTGTLEKGFDAQDISLVVLFDMPYYRQQDIQKGELTAQEALNEVATTYQHRIGRTGRIGKAGVALSFVMPHEMRFIEHIKKTYPTKRGMKKLSPDTFVNDIQDEVDEIQLSPES